MRCNLTVAPALEPVSLDEAKRYLRVVQDRENDLIAAQIRACRELAERYTGRQFCTATYVLYADNWPGQYSGLRPDGEGGYRGGDWILPRAPLQSVEDIKYYDPSSVEQTLAATEYIVETADDEPGRIVLAYGKSWPAIEPRPGGISVTFVAGYGDPEDVPAVAREAILLALGARFGQREAVAAPIGGRYERIPLGFTDLLDSIRVWEVR